MTEEGLGAFLLLFPGVGWPCWLPPRGEIPGGGSQEPGLPRGDCTDHGSGALGMLLVGMILSSVEMGVGSSHGDSECWTLNLDFVLGAMVGLEGTARICISGKVGGMNGRVSLEAG